MAILFKISLLMIIINQLAADCAPGTFLNADNTCENCSLSCEECEMSPENCTKCNGSYLEIPDCHRCLQNKYLINQNECVDQCPLDVYYSDHQKNQCLLCHENCRSCFGPSSKECILCYDESFLLLENSCIPCSEECISCYGETKQCSNCSENQFGDITV